MSGPEEGEDRDAARIYRRLLGYLRPNLGAFILGILGGAIYAGSSSGLVELAKRLGNLLRQPDKRMILWLPVALVVLFAVRGVGNLVQTYFMGYVGRRVVKRLRGQVFERVLDLPVAFYDRQAVGAMLSRLTYNCEQVGQASTNSIVILVRAVLIIIFLLAWMVWINLRLTLLSLIMGPLVAWLVSVINRHFRRYGRRIQHSMEDVTRLAKESFESPRLVKVYGAQGHLSAQFERVNEHNRISNMKAILTSGLANPTVQLVSAVGGAFVLALAIRDTVLGKMSPGDLVAFFTALSMLAQPVREVVSQSGPIQQGVAAAQSLFEILDQPGEPQTGDYHPGRVRGAVEYRDVSFAYGTDKEAALRGVSFTVPAGSQLAIVGRSGSGKSTLVNLLPRFYELSAGAILIDGRDVRDYELKALREQISVVSQEVTLFDDTIRNNIAFGREVTEQALQRAAEAAHVLEFAAALPLGLDTMVGDRGVLLSGGQRQRIAIARALLKDAPILILDEATSALDTEAERHIQSALAQLMRDRTTIVIAHRLSTVEQADRILVLDAGRVVESATHAELLAQDGLYAQLYRLQFSD
ncbi:MAG: lipid A export permease/ATP-binding protein MsbA [Steroidobacteraceae bacterium]